MDANTEKADADSSAALSLDSEKEKLARLYLSTCEMLALYAYEATSRQQQRNIIAEQMTVDNARRLYTIDG